MRDIDIILSYRDGDRSNIGELYDRYYLYSKIVLSSFHFREDEVEDIYQEVFIKFLEEMESRNGVHIVLKEGQYISDLFD